MKYLTLLVVAVPALALVVIGGSTSNPLLVLGAALWLGGLGLVWSVPRFLRK
jgi:hypothetical protein